MSKSTKLFQQANKESNNMTPSTISIILCLFFSLVTPSLSQRCNPKDKTVLLEIKKSLNNPSSFASWAPETDCCAGWDGVECSKNGQNHIISLSFPITSDTNAVLPTQIGEFPFLETLYIRIFDNLTGTIPHSITKLKNLKYFSISQTQVSGSIPEFLGELKNLKELDLSSNAFTGPIPKSLSSLPKLDFVLMTNNKLTGSLPESFSLFNKGDLYIDLADNKLSGTIPQSLSKSNIRSIRLENNKFTGDASMFFGLDKATFYMNLARNRFEFDFSNVKIPRNMVTVLLGRNRIYGELPKDLINAHNLTTMDFSYNRLCGKIPVGGNIQSIQGKDFKRNRCLCGLPLDRKC